MRGILNENMDLNVELSKQELIKLAKRYPGGCPVLEDCLFDENGENIGHIKLEKVNPDSQKSGIIFVETGVTWYVQLTDSVYLELGDKKEITTRIPRIGSQFNIYIR